MNSIELMVQEHDYIKRMLVVVRKACYKILKGEDICFEDFEKMVDFIQNYADKHHHGKEEKFLFQEMMDSLGDLGVKLVRNGMLVEHDLGRLFIKELCDAIERVKQNDEESKLDVIANAISYTHLLNRHIDKENDVIYPFGQKQLTKELMDKVNQNSLEFEEEATKQGFQNRYIQLLEELEKKYI
ncbi:hemerythrin domain-containing protein [Anaeromicropila herbilytica]|uniref:Hemerythrin n=1 Tax=Anaeromicropila herbilytica TaxID=2785025 RepID=A0A7R7IBK8_9FIRM|nr:hemerythrin domain-containing protein [Anaeromicropila herbilytica]BCN29748.1 hemerythrin [Anaeromicropila herbilytica]